MWPDQHDTVGEALEVHHVLGFRQLLGVILAGDLEVGAHLLRGFVAKARDVHDRDDLQWANAWATSTIYTIVAVTNQ